MPRLFDDCRCTNHRRLRAIYRDLEAQFGLTTGVARRIAILAARSWLDYEAASQELERPHKAPTARRLRRLQRSHAGAYLSAVKSLEALGAGPRQADHLEALRQAVKKANGR